MRRFAFALILFCMASGAQADPDKPASPAACDPDRIGARELADCLRTASDKSEHDLTSAFDGALKSIDGKAKMLATRKTRWKRFLNDSQTQWASWRDQECQDLAPLEATSAAGDPRISCIIEHNERRTADLKARYP